MVPNSSTLSPALTLCPVTSMAVRSMHIRPTVFGLKEEGEDLDRLVFDDFFRGLITINEGDV